MFNFKLATEISQFDTFAEFMKEFAIDQADLLLTNEIIFDQTMKKHNPQCSVLFQEQYGHGEPSDQMVNKILADCRQLKFKRIVAVGGGTVIDIAKILALRPADNVLDILYGKVLPVKEKQLVIVPTTCGTGSEVTNISILEDTGARVKKGIVHVDLYPDHAVLIPELLASLPYKFYAFSSIDALIHATESYLAPRSNPMSELFGVKAIEIILTAYRKIADEGENAAYASIGKVLLASNFAGIAFSNTGVGAVHALSYPLGGGYHVPHGEANYAFFVAVLKRYDQINPDGKIKKLKEIIAFSQALSSETGSLAGLEQLLSKVSPLKQLREYGMKHEEVDKFTDSAMAQERLMKNNYVALSRDDVFKIYEARY